MTMRPDSRARRAPRRCDLAGRCVPAARRHCRALLISGSGSRTISPRAARSDAAAGDDLRFSQAMEVLRGEGYGTFVEISPTPVLTQSIPASIALRRRDATALGMMRWGDERAVLVDGGGPLSAQGAVVRCHRVTGHAGVDSSAAVTRTPGG